MSELFSVCTETGDAKKRSFFASPVFPFSASSRKKRIITVDFRGHFGILLYS